MYKPYTDRLRIVDRYIRELFIDELPASIRYHDSDHTLHPTKGVVATAHKLGVMENISKIDRELLITAAYFHDTGFIRDYVKNDYAVKFKTVLIRIKRIRGFDINYILNNENKVKVEILKQYNNQLKSVFDEIV